MHDFRVLGTILVFLFLLQIHTGENLHTCGMTLPGAPSVGDVSPLGAAEMAGLSL